MNTSYMIDSIVQHTTALIAQVATSAGVRAPLSHVAERVFLDLVKEIERQGVARKVVADMFGMALRSYQQKVQRLSESVTDRGRTLWEATYSFIKEQEVATRGEVLRRFRGDDPAMVSSVLQDLVDSGLVYKTGTRQRSVYRIASQDDLDRVQQTSEGLQTALLFRIYREGPLARAALLGTARASDVEIDDALRGLVAEGRVEWSGDQGERAGDDSADSSPVYSSNQCFVPMDDEAAWAASVVNHFQMVTSAICAKLENGMTRALPDDEIGGSSYSFDVYPGHPAEGRVRQLLARTRTEVSKLWSEAAAHNKGNASKPSATTRVNFYFGQSVVASHSGKETE